MKLRILEEADAALYWALRLRALREEPETFGSSYVEVADRPLAEVAARLRPHLEPPEGCTIGALEGGQLLGTVTCMREPRQKVAHKATITGMYVAPEARGRGTGKALLEAAIARARGWNGVEQVILTVVSTNAVALGLYTALGFTPFGREPHALKLDGRYLDEDYLLLWLHGQPDTPAERR